MKIKRIKNIKVLAVNFNVLWDKTSGGASFSYDKLTIKIGTKNLGDGEIFDHICHEIMEIVSLEMHVRFYRTDCRDDYMFVYDHRQHSTMMCMFSSLISQFIV